ncbi:hypothetical protein BUPH_08417 (plasmid) [Paraburkholderia phenoliruptrix BR3459a]|uniref:Uncharacterized protein n=1 Tax=Paraburkholderia phenoliruptrix BR3459a TaxID=1229205 RepID=K0E3U3_9BURK|nr:hypothetical protein BUPH_08417 [Paraburkholderia phenoliruptrix BR3459a]
MNHGAYDAVLVTDRAFVGAITLATPYAFATAILQIAKNRRSISPAPRIITIDKTFCNHSSCCARSLRVPGRFSFSCASSPFGRTGNPWRHLPVGFVR